MAQISHPPIGMGSSQYIEDLPHDMLLEIFSYLSFEDLVTSVQYVSSRWQSVSQDNHLWRKLQYAPALETDEEIVNILKQCPKLQTFILDKKDVGPGVLKSCLKNCTELKKLKLLKCQFSLSKLYVKSLVVNCQKLEHLTIHYKMVSVLDVAQKIRRLKKLQTLDIIGDIDCQRSMWLRSIGKGCPLLQHVDIMLCRFRSTDFKYFMQMKKHQLQSIQLSCSSFDGRCTLPDLTVCKTLKKVAIDHPCQFVTTGGCEVLRSMKNITGLTFKNTDYSVVGNLVGVFSNKGMCQLKELEFDTYLGYKDELCETICHNCPQLEELVLSGCFDLTDRSLENLPQLKYLEALLLNGCGNFTGSGMDFVFKCKHLKELILIDSTQLTEQSLKQLTSLNLLEMLILHRCYVNALPLNMIPISMTKLKYLIMVYCKGVNKEGILKLRAEMPQLIILESGS